MAVMFTLAGDQLSDLFAGHRISLAGFWHFLVWTTLGNAIGGVLLVSVLKFSHSINPARRRRRMT